MHSLRRLQGEWFTDTLFADVKLREGNTCAQIFANDSYFATIYPMDTKQKAGDALRVFCKEFGVPEQLRSDGAREMVGKKTEFMKQIRKHDIDNSAQPKSCRRCCAKSQTEVVPCDVSQARSAEILGLRDAMGVRHYLAHIPTGSPS